MAFLMFIGGTMKKGNLLKEWTSIRIAKSPAGVVLIAILLLNLIFFAIAASTLSHLTSDEMQYGGFWPSLYYTIMMVLDPGCVSAVIEDVGTAGISVIMACISIAIIGMITFTGAVIGYVTNYISDFIRDANSGVNRLTVANHTVILNWNSRASEIINDLLYSEKQEKVIVLVAENRAAVEKEIADRIADTMEKERQQLLRDCAEISFLKRWSYYRSHQMKNRVMVIVREGDTFSTQKLNDISIKTAKSIIILSKDKKSSACKYDVQEQLEHRSKGDSNIIKTLIQVSEQASATDSANNQNIVVEVNDAWTLSFIHKIIQHKEKVGKCNIVPVSVDKILGQILSQFCVMPELNIVYSDLFSNQGAVFYCRKCEPDIDTDLYISQYLRTHSNAVPLTQITAKTGSFFYYMADHENDVEKTTPADTAELAVSLNPNFWLRKRKVIILGHNSKCDAIMDGFNSFRREWNLRDAENCSEILDITIIDDKKSLERYNHYVDYPYVNEIVEADIYDRETIVNAINTVIDSHSGETSILILSDDMTSYDDMDANALAYLIYVQDIISSRIAKDPSFDTGSIDVIVEILNPKNYDTVRSYSIDNIVISNRYISKMVTQIGEKEEIFSLYEDILSYDEDSDDYTSKELYIKPVEDFFLEMPCQCTAEQLVRAVFEASSETNRNIILGYIRPHCEPVMFAGSLKQIVVALEPKDKLIIFSSH